MNYEKSREIMFNLLVSLGLMNHFTYTWDLSTWSSSRKSITAKAVTLPNLEVGFPLICFQRLSRPNVATQQCSWRNSWYTRGSFFPVLSSHIPLFLKVQTISSPA